MNEQAKPYVITFKHIAPNFIARKLAEEIETLIRSEFIADGAKHIRTEEVRS